MFKQFPLSISPSVEHAFDSFYVAPSQQQLVEVLQSFCASTHTSQVTKPEVFDTFFYLWGASGSGVSHLLQACQSLCFQQQQNVQYLPINDLINYGPDEIFSGLESMHMVIIDDVDMLCGRNNWETALFHLYNRLKDSGKKLLVGAHTPAREIPVILEDLKSRLQWGITYRLYSLNDEEKKQAFLFRAKLLGLECSEEVVQFVFNHRGREFTQLIELLNAIDKASLAEQRQITIPFVKKVIHQF